MNIIKKVRNNWKKSTFGVIVLAYGYSWGRDYIKCQELMRAYCQKASTFGKQTIPVDQSPKTITVILNPNANKKNSVDDFEKYCAPILHLAGYLVNVLKTESEGHGKEIVESLSNTDAIVVAGGDGTLCEVVTGLLRRTEENTAGLVPIGFLPLGKHNSLAKYLYPGREELTKVRHMADASMAIVEGSTKLVDVMKVEITEENSTEELKPVYALSFLSWGAFRDAEVNKDKYWYFGSLRRFVTYVFNGYKSNLTWRVDADLSFSPPCEGCMNCSLKKIDNSKQKWYHRFSKDTLSNSDSAKTTNIECSTQYEKKIATSDIVIATSNMSVEGEKIPRLHMKVGPKSLSYIDFVTQGWRSEKGLEREAVEEVDARVISIKPKNVWGEEKEAWFSIDNDAFEVKPVRITLLPKFIKMFYKEENKESC